MRPGRSLWHVTSSDIADAIERCGVMRGPSYWSCDERLTDYYAETVRDEGGEPVVFTTSLDRLPQSALAPDRPGYDEPITTIVGPEDEVRERYDRAIAAGDTPWEASLSVLKSLRVETDLPTSAFGREPPVPSGPA